MTDELPVTLVVEDKASWQMLYEDALAKISRVVIARTPGQARDLFNQYRQDIALIVMDGSLSGDGSLDTLGLVHEFREAGFKRPMVAASSREDSNKALMSAGCDHEAHKKLEALDIARGLLKSRQP